MQIIWSSFQVLTESNVNRYVPKEGGVYILWVKLENGKWRPYYVGQSDDLERRMLEHLSSWENNTCIKNHIKNHSSGYEYAKVSLQNDRNGIEKYLYDSLKPECNEIDPGGQPIQVNLP